MYLIAPNVDIADVWCAGLTRLVRQQPYPKGYSPGTPIDDWLHRTYVTLKQQDRGAVHAVVAVGHFAKRRLWSAFKVLSHLFGKCMVLRIESFLRAAGIETADSY